MKVSIAMATYNGAKYLQEQLNSFLNQTRLPDELVITDDCSTDETVDIIRKFAEIAPFKVIFHQNTNNFGYSGNFNEALMRSSGDIVFLSDQDDTWFPQKIEHILSVAAKSPFALIFMNDAELTDGELKPKGLTALSQIKGAGLEVSYFIMGCCCAIRRELLDVCLPIHPNYKAHDTWINAFARALNAKIVDKKVLQYYRRHESNESKVVVNRTSKVSSMDLYFESLKNILNRSAKYKHEYSIEQTELLVSIIKERVEFVPEEWKLPLINYAYDKEEWIAMQKKRMGIRENKIFLRIPLTIYYFVRGEYKNKGLKSVLRDFLG